MIPYTCSRKLWIGANFRLFRMIPRHTKIITTKLFSRGNVDRAMAYVAPLFPAFERPSRPLSAHVSLAAIQDANEAV